MFCTLFSVDVVLVDQWGFTSQNLKWKDNIFTHSGNTFCTMLYCISFAKSNYVHFTDYCFSIFQYVAKKISNLSQTTRVMLCYKMVQCEQSYYKRVTKILGKFFSDIIHFPFPFPIFIIKKSRNLHNSLCFCLQTCKDILTAQLNRNSSWQ